MLGFVFVALVSLATMVNASAQPRKESNCTVAPVTSPIAADAVLTVRMRKGAFCLHRYDVSYLDRPNVIARGFAKRGRLVANGEDAWGYQAPRTSGADRFTIAVGGRRADGSRVNHVLLYEVIITE